MAPRLSNPARKKAVPALALAVVVLVVAATSLPGLQGGKESFGFRVYWPAPAAYSQDSPAPNAYLQINYTGPGSRTYTYSISDGSSVLARQTVNVTSLSPFSAYVTSPVPAVLQAQVYEGGRLVYRQSLTLG